MAQNTAWEQAVECDKFSKDNKIFSKLITTNLNSILNN